MIFAWFVSSVPRVRVGRCICQATGTMRVQTNIPLARNTVWLQRTTFTIWSVPCLGNQKRDNTRFKWFQVCVTIIGVTIVSVTIDIFALRSDSFMYELISRNSIMIGNSERYPKIVEPWVAQVDPRVTSFSSVSEIFVRSVRDQTHRPRLSLDVMQILQTVHKLFGFYSSNMLN